ncbi:phenylacetic acid degradation bifunctional protein PaaZ [Cloacibacterium normanense]|uniref:Phenylacetic acid degradation protein paaN n=1 Tax=Cloacibacterium normanense TaxID=237258 RepID=A0A1E5UBB7_9FLAO|nr:phenylacetic acid degradation bifunctional protein PaaZ [Cloacibacterium normanense]AZI70075.1 phenylacetic acid degradation bifunctional protein PaaZ [Cloacibacterium normanense]OEL10140.1 phenylacetic acid degradation protein paaN [Cloacibacterium normanense]SDO24102.1 oxepin-CoA hydrolase / 3-oxo-5,6-dehydrosuberyl-CoA semialdehyde dehydrogenase [Cloacibacterium normanense]
MKLKNYISGQWLEGNGHEIPLYNAVNGELVAISDTSGLDFEEALHFGRTIGYKNLSSMTFYDRGEMLKKIALYLLERKKKYYELSYKTGATHIDSWVDIEGGFGTFFTYSGLAKRMLPNTPFWVDGETQKISANGTHLGTHILTPSEGVSVQINAYNFPVWGMLEKLSTSLLAGVPAIVKPSPYSSYLTNEVFKDMIESGYLPEGAIQLICGEPGNILDFVKDGDSVVFTGSANTGRKLKALPSISGNAVRFNMEADSLNCSILGLDAKPGTPEFDLFIKEVKNEMTTKAGQKCTAIRRIIVPENLVGDVQNALSKALDATKIGNPLSRETKMGSIVGKEQMQILEEKVNLLKAETELIYDGKHDLVEANYENGAFFTPKVFYNDKPFEKNISHELEAFGPVSTIMPYKDAEEAAALAKRGKGSLVGSIVSHDEKFVAETSWKMASSHGRIFVLNRDNAKESTGHGSPLPTLMHGGPGRAGGGEEMGGLNGLHFFLQKTAIQGSPDVLTAITKVYTQGAEKKFSDKHPFQKYFEEVEVGDSLETAGRTVTEADIVNFSNVSWDHFYAHTDSTSLNGTIFDKTVAHGYFILSAAAGLFVSGKKGPVIANYGLENASFFKPVYAGDTITVYLTAKEKINRGVKGRNIPSGVVKWLVEVVNQREEVVCVATILTLVAKKSPFIELNRRNIQKLLNGLTENTKPNWGKMTAQQMLEHLETTLLYSIGEPEAEKCFTTEEHLEKYQDSLYNHRKMPKDFPAPFLPEDGTLPELKYKNLEQAKEKFLENLQKYQIYYRENPEVEHMHFVFGKLNKEMMELMHRKHFTHHFEQFNLI